MTVRDTRATELAAAKWENEGRITDLARHDGWATITTDRGIGFGVAPEFAAQRMEVGEEVAICGGLGAPIQGVRVGGRLIFFKTQADLDADRQRFLDDLAAERRAEYEANKDRWRQEVATLEPLLKARMERFIREGGGFELFFLDSGAYELFCCTEAVKFADYFRHRLAGKTQAEAEEEIRAFRALTPEQQKTLVPYDSGHSGNTFGGAVALGARVALGLEV